MQIENNDARKRRSKFKVVWKNKNILGLEFYIDYKSGRLQLELYSTSMITINSKINQFWLFAKIIRTI